MLLTVKLLNMHLLFNSSLLDAYFCGGPSPRGDGKGAPLNRFQRENFVMGWMRRQGVHISEQLGFAHFILFHRDSQSAPTAGGGAAGGIVAPAPSAVRDV
jgi:hypothetical protein